jgi:hypothetical protein
MADNDTKKEPQSYGADKGWVSGQTGGTVDNLPQKSEGGDDAFYNPRRDNETSADFQGGRISPQQIADNAASSHGSASVPQTGSPDHEGGSSGAQRGSFFRSRDYKEK